MTTQPPMTTPQPAAANGTYKRLGFVPEAAEKAEQVYTAAKAALPERIKPAVEAAESRLGEAAAPYVAKAQDKGAELLRVADERVDAACRSASSTYERNSAYLADQLARQRQFHAQNLEAYKSAREAYLKKVEDAVEYMKQRGLTGAAHDAADEVLARVGEAKDAVLSAPAVLVTKVHQAVDGLLAFGPVNSVVEAAKPTLAAARTQYLRVHDSVLATQQYARVYALASDVAQRAQQTWLYAKARDSLNYLPLAKPAMDTATPYIDSLVQHLQPITA